MEIYPQKLYHRQPVEEAFVFLDVEVNYHVGEDKKDPGNKFWSGGKSHFHSAHSHEQTERAYPQRDLPQFHVIGDQEKKHHDRQSAESL